MGHPIGWQVRDYLLLLPRLMLIAATLQDPGSARGQFLTLDGAIYHRIDTNDIPVGFAEVDVKLDDNGQNFDTVLTAGLACTQVCDSGDRTLSPGGKRDTGRPVVAWWMSAKKEQD